MRALKALCVAVLLLLAAAPVVQASCPEEPGLMCGRQCTWFGPGQWYCFDPSDPERLCISFGPGACGEQNYYECCAGGFGGF